MRTVVVGVIGLLLGVALLAAGVWWVPGFLIVLGGVAAASFGLRANQRRITQLSEQASHSELESDHLRDELSARTAERDQLQRALASTGDIVIALDRDARIHYLNPVAQLILRTGDRNLIGAHLLEAVEDPDLYRTVRLAVDDGTPAVMVVLRAGRRFRTVVAPVASVTGTGPWSVVLAMHDLSDLYEAEIARRDFFTNASHELRTPLATISAAAETLEVARRPEDSQRFRSIIQAEAERMGQLIARKCSPWRGWNPV